MTVHSPAAHSPATKLAAPRQRGAALLSFLIIAVPVALALICVAARFDIIDLSHTVRAILLFALLLGLMATGMPISIALGLSVLTYLFILSDVDPKMVGLKLFTSIDRFEIMAIPFFILAGNFLTSGGVAARMIAFATSLIGHWYGGLGLAGVVACALFAAISGSSVATVVGIGSIILPAIVENGYPARFGAGVIATSGALGILFPPSINLVIFAVATSGMQPKGPDGAVVDSASVGQLFIAGLVPGLMLAAMLGATTWYRAWRNDYPRMERASWRQCLRAFRESFWGFSLCWCWAAFIRACLRRPKPPPWPPSTPSLSRCSSTRNCALSMCRPCCSRPPR
jgi:C4-dicarboxylate transporter DctM subunit